MNIHTYIFIFRRDTIGTFRIKIAVITGSSSGIGKATAERFAKEGAVVICADINLDGVKSSKRN